MVTIRNSKSGYYRVKLNAPFPHQDFLYKPGAAITVNREIADAMNAAGVLEHVVAA